MIPADRSATLPNEVDLKKGLPRLREPWILKRGDVEQLPEITSEYGRRCAAMTSRITLRFEHITLPYRAIQGKCHHTDGYAKQGIITPEMEYVAIRENMNCEELGIEPPSHLNLYVRKLLPDVPYFPPISTTPKRADDYRP